VTLQNRGDNFFLHRSGRLVTGSIYTFKEIGVEIKFSKTQNMDVFVEKGYEDKPLLRLKIA
jgi:hypothetical protein